MICGNCFDERIGEVKYEEDLTDENDHGLHTVCAKVTTEFLEWCKSAGNDLITPHPEFGFSGLKDGDGWCAVSYTHLTLPTKA